MRKKKSEPFHQLPTPYETKLDPDLPFADYPRPQLRRDSYLCLNGPWDFSVERHGIRENWGKICVPFVPESRISGIGRQILPDDRMIYERKFALPENFQRDRVILHFGAVDQRAKIFLNDQFVGENGGGYLPFSFDITEFLRDGDNDLRVEATDPLDPDLPYGKQRTKRGGIWYTPISGIWQTVWLESVSKSYIRGLKITPALDRVTIQVQGGEVDKILHLEMEGKTKDFAFSGDTITIPIENPRLWTPETPYLYQFSLESGQDRVESYFALRTISIGESNGTSQILLNGKPYFFHGLLDQGYFSDGIYLPATADGFLDDIRRMKSCGFNTLRKHIKLEPDLFYYACDRLGMVVFQDMINSGTYNFFIDTALPTVFLKKGVSHRASPRRREEFLRTSKGIQTALYNHPSVCYYTIFNEGWGQFDAAGTYEILKSADPTRVYDTTSGWFKDRHSDVESDHVYFKPIRLRSIPGKPMVLSEFGGYSCRVAGHYFNPNQNYGCRVHTTDPKVLEDALVELYEKEVKSAIKYGLSAAIYTQVSDVEDETNGLLTFDRAVLKVSPERLQKVSADLVSAYQKIHGENE